jgi:hypothetical protein
LADPEFALAYRLARRRVVEEAVAVVQRTMSQAAATLQRLLTCGRPNVEARVALGILDQGNKTSDLLALEARIAELERQRKTRRSDAP